MRWSDLNSSELTAQLRCTDFQPSPGGSHHRLALSLEELEPLAAALTCEGGTGMVCPGCGEEVDGCCSELGLFYCPGPPCGGLLLLAPIDMWEPRPA